MFCYCAASRRLARSLTARYDAALAPCGLTAAQFETLSLLQAMGSSSGRSLAEKLVLDKTTLSRNLKPLMEAALVSAQPGETDARQVIYVLSAKGKQRLAKAMPLWQVEHDDSLSRLSSTAATSQQTLQRMIQAMQ